MNVELLTTDEAVRRIHERDHALAAHGRWMRFEEEQAVILCLREGTIVAGLREDGQLVFGPGPNHPMRKDMDNG